MIAVKPAGWVISHLIKKPLPFSKPSPRFYDSHQVDSLCRRAVKHGNKLKRGGTRGPRAVHAIIIGITHCPADPHANPLKKKK